MRRGEAEEYSRDSKSKIAEGGFWVEVDKMVSSSGEAALWSGVE